MEAIVPLIILGQVVFYLFGMYIFLAFSVSTFNLTIARKVYKFLLTICLLLCFILVRGITGNAFFPEAGFDVYMILTLTSFSFLWFADLKFMQDSKIMARFTSLGLGVIFWMSLFTAIKFIPIVILAAFPFYGLLIFAPYLVFVMSLFEINKFSKTQHRYSILQIIIIGLVLITMVQLAMNMISPTPWEFINLFAFNTNLI